MTAFTAWLDESGSNQVADPGTYILSAAICEPHHVSATREAIGELLLSKGGKLHWRDEGRRRQELIARTIASLRVEHLVVVRSNATIARPERQRRLCVERMIPELVAMGVGAAVFESRGLKDDRRDRRTLDHLRQKRIIASSLRIDHVGGRTEPMLWIADACCGAITQLRCGDGYHHSLIESKVTIINIT